MNRPARHESNKIESRNGDRLSALVLLLAGLIITLGVVGCNPKPSKQSVSAPPATRPARIIAQGQILPAGGLIRLAATPGDIVDQIHVAIGDEVTAGQPLMTMRSFKLNEARAQALQTRFEDARQQQESAIEQARLRVATAEVKREQVAAKAKALGRQEEILKVAEKQVTEAEKILERLNSVAKDPLTSDFVGLLQIEQQSIAVGEAQLKYRQQAESLQQAKEAVEFGSTAADQEWQAAKLALEVAENSRGVATIESEMRALEIQRESATVVAPQAAVVVAINTREGEAAAQFPLIELADVARIICEAEVVETDAALVAPNQAVKITSPALPKELNGQVLRRRQLVGRPQLAVADPLARADYRTVTVEIDIDPADVSIASKWLQLQVNVEIEIASGKASDELATEAIAPEL